MASKKVNAAEALEDIQKHVEKCHKSKRYMVAAWCIEDDEVKMLGRVTQDFPAGDFLLAVSQLAVCCSNEYQSLVLKNDDPPPPLPLADLVKGIREQANGEE